MDINQLHFYHFRNYKDQTIAFQKGVNLLVGLNGQGKTNALEGIYYLLTGKSYRVKLENELIKWGEKNFYLQASVNTKDRIIRLQSYYETGKKVMKINELACKRLSDYVGTVNAVFFSPDDLNIVKSSPSERRKFLDLLIAQVKPSHIAELNTYGKIIRQKNGLLKNTRSPSSLRGQLQAWNAQLVEVGQKIMTNRWHYNNELNRFSQPIFKHIFSSDQQMDLTYAALGKKNIEDSIRFFPDLLENKLDQEIEKKMVLVGPHRDDIAIELNGHSARLYGSQGQQRALVLCLKLAEMEIIKNVKDEYPILLLDDVLSELDPIRREYLIDYIQITGKQTIITMTDADQKVVHSDHAVFRVKNGTIGREK